MLRAQNAYSSVIAKVRAMYGKMLSMEDWEKLCEMAYFRDVVSFLRLHKGFEKAMAPFTTQNPDKKAFAQALRNQVFAEYESIFFFASREDRAYLSFIVYKTEYLELLSCLRRLVSGAVTGDLNGVPSFFEKKTKLNLNVLRRCTDYGALTAASADTIYYSILSSAETDPETGLPDYAEIGVLLENRYYRAVYSFLTKKYHGAGARMLLNRIGFEADFLNIMTILRLHRFFRGSLPRAQDILIPIHKRLSLGLRTQLIEAPSETAAIELLKSSPWREYFFGYDSSMLERMYYIALRDFSKKTLRGGQPNICVPQAYLTLRELEAESIIRIAESIYYGVDPRQTLLG